MTYFFTERVGENYIGWTLETSDGSRMISTSFAKDQVRPCKELWRSAMIKKLEDK